ncbi:hypothetical protein GF312_20825 [Candidatus Poribacteria bacterium]|nr:hypothetical protein [Candidatus Poribacteria bacterium]
MSNYKINLPALVKSNRRMYQAGLPLKIVGSSGFSVVIFESFLSLSFLLLQE